jgi:hypothetical protein
MHNKQYQTEYLVVKLQELFNYDEVYISAHFANQGLGLNSLCEYNFTVRAFSIIVISLHSSGSETALHGN